MATADYSTDNERLFGKQMTLCVWLNERSQSGVARALPKSDNRKVNIAPVAYKQETDPAASPLLTALCILYYIPLSQSSTYNENKKVQQVLQPWLTST